MYFQEIRNRLASLPANGPIDDEMRQRIFEVVRKAKKLALENGESKIPDDCLELLNEKAMHVLGSGMTSFFQRNPTMSSHAYTLVSYNLTSANDLIYASYFRPGWVASLGLPNDLFEMLRQEYQVMDELIRTLKTAEFSDEMNDFLNSFRLRKQLCALSWAALEDNMEKFKLANDEKQTIMRTIWAEDTQLRQELTKSNFPGELIDELEAMGPDNLDSLSRNEIEQLNARYILTNYQQSILNKVVRKSAPFFGLGGKWGSRKQIAENFVAEVNKARNVLSEIMNGSDTETASKLLNDLGYRNKADCSNAERLKTMLDHTAQLFTPLPEPPYESDEKMIAGIDDGAALRGLCLGMIEHSNDLIYCNNAPRPLFKTPSVCKVKEINQQTLQRKNFGFSNKNEAMQFKMLVFSMGLGFAEKSLDRFESYLGHSALLDQSSGWIAILSFIVCSTVSVQLEEEDFVMTREASNRLEGIVEASDAGDFLLEFGSHILIGPQQFGSIMCYSIEISLPNEEKNARLAKFANEFMERSVSGLQFQPNNAVMETFEQPIFGDVPIRVQCKYETENRGPVFANFQLFAEITKYMISDWHVIDRNVTSSSVLAIWKWISKKFPDNKRQAELLRNSWLKRVASANSIDMVAREVKRTASNYQEQMFEDNKNKILTLLKKFDSYASITSALDDDILMKQLEEFIQLMNSCKSLADKEGDVNPWITFVSERREFADFLILLAQQHIKHAELPKTTKFLREAIDDEFSNALKRSGYPMSETVRSYLSPSKEESEELVAFKKRREVVRIANLTRVLQEEFAEAKDHADPFSFQWKLSSLVEAALQTEDASNPIRNSLHNVLTTKFNWSESKFQYPITNEAFAQLTDEIEKLTLVKPMGYSTIQATGLDIPEPMECDGEAEPEEESQQVRQEVPSNEKGIASQVLSSKTINANHGEKVGGFCEVGFQIKPFNLKDPARLQRKQQSMKQKKKTFFELLTDYPQRKTSTSTAELSKLKQEFLRCLRHRMNLGVLLHEENDEKMGLYDILLELVDDFGPSGVYEIYLLLLERRFMVPIFNPLTGEQYLTLLREVPYVIVPNEPPIRLGSDTSLFRIALISCCQPEESQTAELLKSLFSIDSFHINENDHDNMTKKELTIDVGIGYVDGGLIRPAHVEPHRNHHVMVVHVMGDIYKAADFIKDFSDLLLVEDDDGAFRSLVGRRSKGISTWVEDKTEIVVWTPSKKGFVRTTSEENKQKHGFGFEGVNAPLGKKLINALGTILNDAISSGGPRAERKNLSNFELFGEDTYAMEGLVPFNVEFMLNESVQSVAATRRKFLLQLNFRQQFIYEDQRNEKRFDQQALETIEREISKCYAKRQMDAKSVGKVPLVEILVNLLEQKNPSIRVMSLRQLEQGLSSRTELQLKVLQDEINSYYELVVGGVTGNSKPDGKTSEEIVKKYAETKQNYREAMLHLEHVWRELSHLYVSNSEKYRRLPELAARHLLDGFSIELLDGDANLVNLPWISAVFAALNNLLGISKNRIFVLSVMGVQSSGKSTLLNTMFGIKMRTSVGQCTRGINMQLLPVEGREEYDYVLVLDTEGTRSPDFHGMVGNEKRDNQMATLSILLADATIVVNPGENDAAVKEILPIVLLAYQGSKLAEDNGGRLSSMMFFIYNRIDTTQNEKLTNIIQALANSLMDAFKTVREMGGYKITDKDNVEQANCLFRHFKLDASNSAESDVRILGQNKISFTPPDNVPDPKYGESLTEFREHIHKRVTGTRDGVRWQSRTPDQLSMYLHQIWKCICSSDFNLQFTHVLERAAFDLLEAEYQKIKHDLASGYQSQFVEMRKKMITMRDDAKDSEASSAGNQRSEEMKFDLNKQMDSLIVDLNKLVEDATSIKGREKWRITYQQNWTTYKEQQRQYWRQQIKYAFDTIFFYDQEVEKLRKAMRQTISALYKNVDPNHNYTQGELKKKFDGIVDEYLTKAKTDYPSIKVEARIRAVYSDSAIIRRHCIDVFNYEEEIFCVNYFNAVALSSTDHHAKENADKANTSFLSRLKTKVSKMLKVNRTSDSVNFEQTPDRLIEISRELSLCLKTIQEHAKNILVGVACYDDSIVSTMIEKTDKILLECRKNLPIEHSHRTFAHTYTRIVLAASLQEIQWRWELHNSVPAKFGDTANIEALWQFFHMVASGANKMKLFGLLIRQKFSNLRPAFEAEMLVKTTSIVKQHKWLYDFKSTQNYMDQYLINLIDNGEVPELIRYISQPQKLLTEVLLLLISGIAKDLLSTDKGWNKYVDDLAAVVRNSTADALKVEKNRASKFVESLQRGLLSNLESDVLGQSLARELGDEYNDLDNELEENFVNTCEKEVIELIRNHLNPTESTKFSRHISQLVVDQLRKENAAGAMPRCEQCCPWCGSMCILEAGHDPEKLKHDTIHQPAGLGGMKCYKKHTLVPRMCSQYTDEQSFIQTREDDTEEEFLFGQWYEKYPDWMKPHYAQDWPLREYIFFHHHGDFAKYYGSNPCDNMVPTYNRDLNLIKDNLKKTQVGHVELFG